ncbi:MAG: 2-hydroxychromene-2-carboxylate isomerase [Polyangiales bacterium]
MPSPSIDFWFDYTCPYAYLGSTQVEALALRTGRALAWKPMLLGGVFKANATPQRLFETLSPPKAAHNANDLARQAERYGVALRMPSGHPFRSVEALRATLATGCDPRVIHGFFRAYWVEGRPISEVDVMRDVLNAAGHDADAVLSRIGDEGIKNELRARTDEAIALGVFGAPAYLVDGVDLYWGQDRAELFDVPSQKGDFAAAPKGRTLEVYWDFASPYAYLGSVQAEALARRTGATLVWRPVLLGAVFKALGQANVPLATYPEAKQRHTGLDLERWARHLGAPFRFPSRFPMSTVKALRAWIALPEGARDAFRARVFRAYWAEDRDISDDAVLAELLGPDARDTLDQIATSEVKQRLVEATQRALDAGVFGVPTWVVDGRELFWGQDRVALVERALTR